MPVPTAAAILGIAKEVTKGTPVSPTAYVPIPTGRTWQDLQAYLDDTASRGSAIDGPFDQILGGVSGMYDTGDAPAFADTLPWWVLGILGDYTSLASRTVADAVLNSTTLVTSATAAFTQNDVGRSITTSADFAAGTFIVSVTNATTIVLNQATLTTGASKSITIGVASLLQHIGAVKNSGDQQCTAFTLSDYYGLTGTHTRQFAGCQVAEVNLKFTGDGLFTVAVKLAGFASLLVAAPTAAFSSITPHPGWEPLITIAGSNQLNLISGELNLKRNVTAIQTADGSTAPYKIWQGPLAVTGKATFVGEDDSEYLRYLQGTKPAMQFDFRHGTGASTVESRFQMSKVNYKNAKMNHGGDYMAVETDLVALPNATDVGASGGFGALKASFQNAVAAATYQ